MSAPRRSPLRRWLFRLVAALFALAFASWLPVLVFAVLPVPETAVMLGYRFDRLGSDEDLPPLQHDWVSADAIAPAMRLAAVAAEDQQFIVHHGFDVEAIRKAIEHNAKGGSVRGASTISQQTAKNLFLWTGRSWLRKGLEVWFTVLIELTWSKSRILTVYLNSAEFDRGVYGVEAAARHHFGTSAAQLSTRQAALLAAVLPSPLRYDASHPSAYVASRASWIQRQMRQLGPSALPDGGGGANQR